MGNFDNALLIVDADGTALGNSWQTPIKTPSLWRIGSRTTLFDSISREWKYGNTVVITGRPGVIVEELLAAAPNCRFGIGECGGVMVVPEWANIIIPNPRYDTFRRTQRQLVVNAVNDIMMDSEFQGRIENAGTFLTAICYYPTAGKSVGKKFISKAKKILKQKHLLDYVYLVEGDALDLFPRQPRPLDKSVAIFGLPESYRQVYGEPIPSTIVVAGDSRSDIPMFEAVKSISRHHVFVTNDSASGEVKRYVRANEGIVSGKAFAGGIEDALHQISEREHPSFRER